MNRIVGISIIVLGLAFSTPATAQGIATWLGDRLGVGDVGRAIDKANDGAKQLVPVYGQTEELLTNTGRHLTTEILVESSAPVLKNMILFSRDDALRAGAGPLPPEVVWEFTGFYGPDVLSAAWRVGQGNELSLQANSFRFGDRAAIALDTVLVFRSMQDAYSVWLWAHELAHIEQYRAWGVDDFTKRYIRDYDGIEAAANRRADQFMAFRSQRYALAPAPAPMPATTPGPMPMPMPMAQPNQNGNMCVTPVNQCPWVGPVGWNCMCASPYGLQNGTIH